MINAHNTETPMFILHFTNVTCSSDGRAFDDMELAIAHGRECGFEFSVVEVENADPFIWGGCAMFSPAVQSPHSILDGFWWVTPLLDPTSQAVPTSRLPGAISRHHRVNSMSHEVENMAFVGQVPWHGLGNQLTQGQPLEIWRKESGLNYEVLSTPALYQFDYNGTPARSKVPGKHVLYRSDTMAPLNIVSDQYKIVQPAEVLEFFNEVAEAQHWQLHTAGVLKQGGVYWALAKTGLHGDVRGDSMHNYCLISTSADGSQATIAGLTSIRVVCWNTLSWSTGNGQGRKGMVKTNHRSVFDADAVKREIGLIDVAKEWSDFLETCNALAETHVSRGTAKAYLLDLVSDGVFSQEMSTAMEAGVNVQETADKHESGRKFKALWDTYTNDETQRTPAAKDTAFGLVNAVTRHVDHNATARSDDNRLQSAWFGAGDQLKTNALNLAKQLARLPVAA